MEKQTFVAIVLERCQLTVSDAAGLMGWSPQRLNPYVNGLRSMTMDKLKHFLESMHLSKKEKLDLLAEWLEDE